jgi:hypothetical protein
MREDRFDPVEILARVGGFKPEDPERAYQVWVDKARKAGWTVLEEPGYQAGGHGTLCGLVAIEGLAYRVHYGLRVRSTMTELLNPGSAHLIQQALASIFRVLADS